MQIIDKYKNHPSIVAIKKKYGNSQFSFTGVERNDLLKDILKLDSSKASQANDIPTKIIKMNADLFADFLIGPLNDCIRKGVFPSIFKLADIVPVFKKGSNYAKDNYRPVSILKNLSKTFERAIFRQISSFFEDILSMFQCGFRKGFSTQTCLIALLEKWKQCQDSNKFVGALLTDLSKAFDCLLHELLIAKLDAYGFDFMALKLVHSYLTDRFQRTKVGDSFSSWREILFGVPQGSILGPLLFNVFLCDLFLVINDVEFASFADDTTPYVIEDSLSEVVSSLEKCSEKLFQWFSDNQMKANPEKCNLIVNSSENVTINVNGNTIKSSEKVKLLGINIDKKLNFKDHIDQMCKKANQKLNALSRVAPYMEIAKRKLLFNAFFQSQFNYCPLTWMCHNRQLSNKINRVHERCLRVIYNDKKSSFQELLDKNESVCIHHKNLQALCIEMFKVERKESPEIFSRLFHKNETSNYELRNPRTFNLPQVRTIFSGTESISVLGPKIWNLLPEKYKKSTSLSAFKKFIKKWVPTDCPCRLCKRYVNGVGFI